MAKKSAASRGYRRQKTKKPYLTRKEIITLCAIAALLLVGVILLLTYNDGALKVKDGVVVKDSDNWLIVNGSNTRGGKRYYKLGEVGEVEGFTRTIGSYLTDDNLPEFHFSREDESVDETITISTNHYPTDKLVNLVAKSLRETASYTVSDVASGEVGGQAYSYYIYTTESRMDDEESAEEEAGGAEADDAAAAEGDAAEEAEEEAEPNYFTKTISCYLEAAHDSSIVITTRQAVDARDALMTDEEIRAMAEQAVAAVTLDPIK